MNDKAFIAPCALVCSQNCKVPENICDYLTNVVKLSHFIFALLHFSFPAIFPNSTHSERGCQWCSVHSPSSSATTLALEQSEYGHWLKIVLLFRRICLALKFKIIKYCASPQKLSRSVIFCNPKSLSILHWKTGWCNPTWIFVVCQIVLWFMIHPVLACSTRWLVCSMAF